MQIRLVFRRLDNRPLDADEAGVVASVRDSRRGAVYRNRERVCLDRHEPVAYDDFPAVFDEFQVAVQTVLDVGSCAERLLVCFDFHGVWAAPERDGLLLGGGHDDVPRYGKTLAGAIHVGIAVVDCGDVADERE